MTNFKFIEDTELSGVRITSDGYLVAEVKCARTGIQDYLGSELGKPELGVVHVYRPESAVFAKDSLATFVGKPVTDNHPDVMVDSSNWKDLARGSIGEGVLREGEYIKVPITLMDKDLIDKVRAGKREISMGYQMDLKWQEGITDDGDKYHAVMDNLVMNHLAIVDRGRAGSNCRVGDNETKKWGVAPTLTTDQGEGDMPDVKTVLVDGLQVTTTDAGAQAIDKLQGSLAAKDKELADKDAKHQQAIDAKDAELATKDAEIAELKKNQLSDEDISKLIADRTSLIADASKLAKDVDYSNLSDKEIRKAALTELNGADSIDGKSDAYIEAAFDIALSNVKDSEDNNGVRKALQQRDQNSTSKDNGQSAYETRLTDGWKQGDN